MTVDKPSGDIGVLLSQVVCQTRVINLGLLHSPLFHRWIFRIEFFYFKIGIHLRVKQS